MSSTNWAQGGLQEFWIPMIWRVWNHMSGILWMQVLTCDEAVVRSVITEASDRIRDLIGHGVQFDHNSSGEYDMAIEGGHSGARIFHTRDRTGAEIERALTEVASDESETPNDIRELDGCRSNSEVHGDPLQGVSGAGAISREWSGHFVKSGGSSNWRCGHDA